MAGCCCCSAPEPPSNGVQIKVNVSSLSDAEVEDLKAKLAAIAGSDSNVSTVFNGEATWNYSTDLEPQAFADQIDFATVKSVSDRVITLSVTSPPAENADGDPAADGAADADSADAESVDAEAADAASDDADATADGAADTVDG